MEGCSAARAQRRRPPQARRWRGRAPGRWTAFGVAGCVCGSWWRIRHQRAAAGWSSGSGPAAAADPSRWAASKPDRVRSLSLSSSSGRTGSLVALGLLQRPVAAIPLAYAWPWRRVAFVELQLEDSAGPAGLGWAGGSQVAGVDLGAGSLYLYVGDQPGRHWTALGRPGHRCRCRVKADLVGELSNKL